jgi:tRNA pseudouridine38-40 synthase
VQGELEEACATVLRQPVTLHGAGRTDRGVHALGQVASLRTRSELACERLLRGANALTGPDLTVRDLCEADAGFHARHSARARHYCYLLLRERSALWGARAVHVEREPDLVAMRGSAAALVGDHDFAGLSCRSADEESTRTRVLYACWDEWSRGWMLRIGAVRFLYRMVRSIVAGSLEIGYGRLPADALQAALDRPAPRARLVAPGRGLHLVAVDYAPPVAADPGGLDCVPPVPVL